MPRRLESRGTLIRFCPVNGFRQNVGNIVDLFYRMRTALVNQTVSMAAQMRRNVGLIRRGQGKSDIRGTSPYIQHMRTMIGSDAALAASCVVH